MRKVSITTGHTYVIRLEFVPEVCDRKIWLTGLVQDRNHIHFATEGTSFGRSP